MNYFATAPFKTGWKMAPSQFADLLAKRWPAAKIRDRRFLPPFPLDWEIEMPGGLLQGVFKDDPLGISVDGGFEDCIAFALWFRSLVPPQQELWFYDEYFSNHVVLKPDTQAESLAAAFP